MLFSELVLQGVRRFDATHRFPMGAGFTAFLGGAGAGKSTVVEVLTHVLYPNPIEPATTAFQSFSGAPCRVALLIDDQQKQRYRLVQDLGKGAIALTKLDPASGKFNPVSSAAAEILQYLSSTLHCPQRDLFEGIYLFRKDGWPSQRASMMGQGLEPPSAGLRQAGHPGSGKGFQGAAGMRGGKSPAPARRLPPSPHLDGGGQEGDGPRFPGYQGNDLAQEEVLPDRPEELRAQIQILERDLKAAQEVDQAQFKLDGLQAEMFALDEKLKGYREATGRVAKLEAQMKSFDSLASLPADFEQRIRDFQDRKIKFERDLARLQEEKESWERKSQESSVPSLWGNKNFRIGLLVGVVGLLVGIAGFFTWPTLRYAAFLDIIGFGLAAVAAIRHLDEKTNVLRNRSRLDLIDQRRQKLERQFELDSAVVRRTMDAVGTQVPEEITARYNQRGQLQKELDQAREQVRVKHSEVKVEEIDNKKKSLQESIGQAEAQLAGASGLTMGPKDMELRLSALQEKLARLENPGTSGEPPPEAADGAPGPSPDQSMGSLDEGNGFLGETSDDEDAYAQNQPAGPDLCQALFKMSQDVFLTDLEKLAAVLTPRVSQYVAALTNQACPQVILQPNGSVQCLDAVSKETVDASSLPGPLQDLVYLGLRLTILEQASRRQSVPVLLDDPFLHFPPALLPLLGKMLAGIGRTTQVVLFTSQGEWAQHASASFQI